MATAATTVVVLGLALGLALVAPLNDLAEATSRLTLLVLALVNTSLIRIKKRAAELPPGIYQAPSWVPWGRSRHSIMLLAAAAAANLWA